MQDLHRAADDAFIAADAGRIFQSDRLAFQRTRFDVDAHLAVLIANVAVNALTFLGSDFELRPASPKVHPERQWTPHPAPHSLPQERIHADRDRTGEC